MVSYNDTLPFLFIHVPKTAGASVRQVVMGWYGAGFVHHYFNEQSGGLPQRSDLFDLHTPEMPVCVYGHFNRHRGFGVQDNYPDAKQFMTVLRDPFEMVISEFYFIRKVSMGWKDRSRVPQGSLTDHLMSVTPNMLGHFPRPVTTENYKDIIDEFFIEIGFVEELVPSLQRIATSLGRYFEPDALEWRNATERDNNNDDEMQKLRDLFQERNRLEFDVYEYAKKQFGSSYHQGAGR